MTSQRALVVPCNVIKGGNLPILSEVYRRNLKRKFRETLAQGFKAGGFNR